MTKKFPFVRGILGTLALAASFTAIADAPIPITADAAFDAVTTHIDPESGATVSVVLLDIRDPVEYFFSGAPAKVLSIKLLDDDELIEPDNGKVRVIQEGKFLEYRVNGRYRRMLVDKIETLNTEQLALHFPYWTRTPTGWDKSNADPTTGSFYPTVATLADQYDVLILYCRTGVRSSLAAEDLDPTLFWKVYEIDDPGGEGGHGGFSGSNYDNVFNGQVGFPGRMTSGQIVPSASWMDSGLAIVTTTMPDTLDPVLPEPTE